MNKMNQIFIFDNLYNIYNTYIYIYIYTHIYAIFTSLALLSDYFRGTKPH